MAIGALTIFAADSLGIILRYHEMKKLAIVALIIIAFLTGANIIGVKTSGIVQDVLTFLKVAIWIVFTLCGIFFIKSINLTIVTGNSSKLATAVLIAIWAYLGFEEITMPAEEIKNLRDIPLAIIITISFATILYIAVSIVTLGILGPSKLATLGKRRVETAARVMWGTIGGDIFSLFMVFSIVAVMNGVLLANSRLLFAFARDGLISVKLAKVHSKFRTPWIAILTQALIASLVVIFFTTIAEVLSMIDFVLLVPYLFVSAALLVQSIRRKSTEKAPFRLPCEKIIAIIAFIMSAILIVNFAIDPSNLKAIAYGVTAIIVGIPIYFISTKARKTS